MSLEAIGAELGKHPSTVGYWLKKHGLTAPMQIATLRKASWIGRSLRPWWSWLDASGNR